MHVSRDAPIIFAQDDARVADILRRRMDGLIAAEEALAELADADCGPAIAALVAERLHLTLAMVLSALTAAEDHSISVMCRAAGFNINGYSAVLRMRRRHGCGNGSAPTEALNYFSGLPRASAERIVQQVAAQDPDGRAA